MNYQWYPGHMTKAVRNMKEELQLVDMLIELLDARVALSSRNPDIDELGKNKYRLVILNKSDLADARTNALWKDYFAEKNIRTINLDARNGSAVKKIEAAVKEICADKIERDRKRGIKNRPIRAMVCGIPNVGKSTFINSFVGKTTAKTGNKPGVTKANQWIRLSPSLELLDTPGILWPKFEDQQVGLKLAIIGSINDQILSSSEMAMDFIPMLKELYPGVLNERYGIDEDNEPVVILEAIARVRGALKKGDEADYDKAAALLIDEFRSGKLGKLSLERP